MAALALIGDAKTGRLHIKMYKSEQFQDAEKPDGDKHLAVTPVLAAVAVMMQFSIQSNRLGGDYEMSSGIQLRIAVQLYNQPVLDSTGYLLRERRKVLGITSRQLAKRLGVDKALILKAELSKTVLDMPMLNRVCTELDIVPFSVIDDEYRFVHEGYKSTIGFLVDKLGLRQLLAMLNLKDAPTLNRWQTGKTTPTLEQKRALLALYNAYAK